MNTIKFIIVVSIVLLASDLIYHQIVNAEIMPKGHPDGIKLLLTFEDGRKWVTIPNRCVEYHDDFLDGHAEVQINKYSFALNGDDKISCEWRVYADYFINQSYQVIWELDSAISLRGQPIA